ncbi:hypothetical protein BKA82DRAFT_21745 [Pisolithus tinctorius]|nr:hypothetical protein BKA82DRAFT_21745 [Pisolithus tinctorius]
MPSLRSAFASAVFVPANTLLVGVLFLCVGLASEPFSRPCRASELVGVGLDLTPSQGRLAAVNVKDLNGIVNDMIQVDTHVVGSKAACARDSGCLKCMMMLNEASIFFTKLCLQLQGAFVNTNLQNSSKEATLLVCNINTVFVLELPAK